MFSDCFLFIVNRFFHTTFVLKFNLSCHFTSFHSEFRNRMISFTGGNLSFRFLFDLMFGSNVVNDVERLFEVITMRLFTHIYTNKIIDH